ncbi:MAG: hypothetical protein C0397_09910 [Odoribacter sp.]|nr:hypothetical protein [Odoribacter sp.]
MNNWFTKAIYKFYKIIGKKLPVDEIYFKNIIIKDKTPNNKDVRDREFIEIVYKGKSYWAIFRCPCGCENIISLPLQNTHNPFWEISHSIDNRPTLYPSIWQNEGCLSHFWIEAGKIKWCSNTGTEPWK